MKSCFVALSAKFIHSSLGLQVMASLAGAYDEVSYVELSVNQTARELLRQIPEAERYFFSAYIWNRSLCLHLMRDLRRLYPHCHIYVGGPEGRAQPEDYLQAADGIIIGEGESVLIDLLEGRDNVHIYRGGELPAPNREKRLDYRYPFEYLQDNKIVYYETQRGCPYRCSYCMSATDQGLVYAPMDKVKADLMQFIERGVPLVKLVDRTFNSDEARALELLRFLIENQGSTRFHFELAPYLLSDALLEVLAEGADLFQVEIGFQAFQKHVLHAIDRPSYSDRALRQLEKLMKLPLHRHVDLIVGLPNMGMKDIRETFNYLYALNPDELQLGFLKLMPATPLYDKAEQYGLVASSEPPYEILRTPQLSFAELNHLKAIEQVAELLNGRDYPFTMGYLLNTATAFDVYDRLAQALPVAQTTLENRLRQIADVMADPLLAHYLELDYHRLRRHRKELFGLGRTLSVTEILEPKRLRQVLDCIPDLEVPRLQQRIAIYTSAVLSPYVLYDYDKQCAYLLEEK